MAMTATPPPTPPGNIPRVGRRGGAAIRAAGRGEVPSVTVPAALDHGHARDAPPHHLADHPEVVPDGGDVDLRPSGVLLPTGGKRAHPRPRRSRARRSRS